MRILLINPWEGEYLPPPSLGYLQSSIKQIEGVDVRAMDMLPAMNEPDEYDIVAVSFHSFSVKHARAIRDKFKKAWLICGGHHPSALPQQMLSIGYNQVCVGEGEKAIVDIIGGNRDSVIYGSQDNIDSYLFPDYTGFGGNWSMGMPVISSRGCPFSCSFCGSASFWNRRWRMRSADNVLEEVARTCMHEFIFEDDNFTVNRNRVLDICEGMKTMNLSWQCASRAETLQDEDMVMKMKESGCFKVWLGIESLSQDSLDRCNKNTTVEKMLNGIATADKHGIATTSQFISGLPGDTITNINETVSNIKGSKITEKWASVIWLLPNTELYRKAKEYGFDYGVYLSSGAPFYTYEQSLETLQSWADLINTA